MRGDGWRGKDGEWRETSGCRDGAPGGEIHRMPSIRSLRRALACVVAVLLVAAPSAVAAPPSIPAPTGLTATVGTRTVDLRWAPVAFPGGTKNATIQITRDGTLLTTVPGASTSYQDGSVATGQSHSYVLTATGTVGNKNLTSPPSNTATVTLPGYLVGAANADITPVGIVNQGGFGLGDGSFFPEDVVGRGGRNQTTGERIKSRAMVLSDGVNSIAIADIETQGYFAAYEEGPWGLHDMAAEVADDLGDALPADHILIASDHTHSGPDTIGVWGGMRDVAVDGYEGPNAYFKFVFDQTVKAIEDAYAQREFATVVAGHSDAPDLIYNQSCPEALNQSKKETYPGPTNCVTEGKDGTMRVLQARDGSGNTIITYMAYAAHATLGGGGGLHGDWPQFLSEAMADGYSHDGYSVAGYGGLGLAMEGANGGTQPCRPACSFTDPSNPGYNVNDRRTAYTLNYMAHVDDALDNAHEVTGPVGAAQSYIREAAVGPTAFGLFAAGSYIGAEILRSHESPWAVGNTIRTVASALRVGDVLFVGTPGEGYPAIGQGVRNNVDASEVIQLGLANDQLGYLIAPSRYVPVIAAEAAVNDNILFNVSPTIGDHVMCADLALSLKLGFTGQISPECLPYVAEDTPGDPIGQVPVGGLVLPHD